MHPVFQGLFVTPADHQPLRYEGTTGKGRWKDGVLIAIGSGSSYPVNDGIPDFVSSSVEAWTQSDIEEIRKGDWIRRNWESQVAEAQGTSRRVAFFKLMAERDGIILDVASGPGGGNMPGTVYYNSEAKVLMNDLGARVLREWRNYLKDRGLGNNVCLAAFDATNMPIRSNSFDMVTSRGGFSNIPETHKAIKEAHRILKQTGTLLIIEGEMTKTSLSQLPEKVLNKWKKAFPHLGVSYEKMLKDSGFSIVSYCKGQERALTPDEAELPRLANKYGVTLHTAEYYIHAEKQKTHGC
jgi:ubiquinone/menaquinone biosynthesis C-methylase UbiE/uncharacterized protein YbaR (Trm112 family)